MRQSGSFCLHLSLKLSLAQQTLQTDVLCCLWSWSVDRLRYEIQFSPETCRENNQKLCRLHKYVVYSFSYTHTHTNTINALFTKACKFPFHIVVLKCKPGVHLNVLYVDFYSKRFLLLHDLTCKSSLKSFAWHKMISICNQWSSVIIIYYIWIDAPVA